MVFDYLWQECGNNKIRHARQARLRAAKPKPACSSLFLFVCFFFNGCRNCKCIFCLSFLIPQNGTYPYLFKYKLNCRPTPKKRLFQEAKHTEKHLWLMYSRLQLLKNLAVNHPILCLVRVFLLNKCLRKIQRPAHQPNRSTSTKPSVPDINATHDMINDLFSADEVVQFLPLH